MGGLVGLGQRYVTPEVVHCRLTPSDDVAHVFRVAPAQTPSTNHPVASGGAVSTLLALIAEGLRAISNVLVVGQLVDSSIPVERQDALGVADAAFLPVFEHLAGEHVGCGFLLGRSFVSAIPALKRILLHRLIS